MPENELPVIAHVLHRLAYAGAEVLAAALARQLRGRYHSLFFCLDAKGPLGEELEAEGFTVLQMQRKPGIDLAVARRIGHACATHQVALLHAHQYTPFFYAAVSRRWRRQPRILLTEHGRHYPDCKKIKHLLANQCLFARTDRATAVGRFVADALVRNEGIAARRVQVIYNGIDPARFQLTDTGAARQAIRRELALSPDQRVALQVARFHPVKDHATCLHAWKHVTRHLPGAVLLLAGDGPEKQAMQQLACQLGIQTQVRFLGVRKDIPQLMAASDVFVLSSLSEGISVTLLEAMAASVPICATRVGGNAEVVLHEKTGLLSARQDSRALGANLSQLLTDPEQCRRYACAGRRRVCEHFNQKNMHHAFEKVYDQMCGRPAGRVNQKAA